MQNRLLLLMFLLLSLICNPNIGHATAADQHKASYENLLEEGVYLVINKGTNRLTVYLNGYPVYKFPVGTGKNKELTPEGCFIIKNKVKNPWYLPKNIKGGAPENPLGSRWIGLNVPNTNGYKYGIHGTNNPESIGHYVSQGCIRMHNKDVEWIHRHIPLNTIVYIIDQPE